MTLGPYTITVRGGFKRGLAENWIGVDWSYDVYYRLVNSAFDMVPSNCLSIELSAVFVWAVVVISKREQEP